MKKERPRLGGQITIFLSLLLMTLISFLCVALASARSAGSRYLFSLASEAAAKSMFAAYDTKVWEQYRILMLTDEELAGQLGEECAQAYTGGALFPVVVSAVELTEPRTFGEEGARAWEEGAVSYMENRLPAELISWLWEQSGLASGLEDLTRWVTGFRDLLEPLTQLEQRLCELEAQLSEAVEAFAEGKRLAESIGDSAQALSQLAEAGAEPEELGAAWNALKDTFEQIQGYAQGRQDSLSRLMSTASEQLEAAGALKRQVEELAGSLAGGESPGAAVMAGIGDYIASLTERAGFLERLPEQLTGQRELLERLGGFSMPSLEEVLSGNAGAALSSLAAAASGLSGAEWNPERLEAEEGSEADRADLRRLLELKDWLDEGILWMTLEDSGSVSQASLEERLVRTQRAGDNGLLDQAYRNLLYGEYALRYTASYTGEGRAGLKYETEYLIAGQDSDSANLAAVASQLLLMRGAANLAFLMTDEAKRTEARTVAAGISAALGGFVPAALLAMALMVLWALAEAVCDVRGLFAGRRVPFWKSASDWQLSWGNILDLFGDGFLKSADRESGMDYEAYLRLLLFLVPLREKCFRTMEIAQENLRADRNGFEIGRAISRAVVTVTGQAAGQNCRQQLSYGY